MCDRFTSPHTNRGPHIFVSSVRICLSTRTNATPALTRSFSRLSLRYFYAFACTHNTQTNKRHINSIVNCIHTYITGKKLYCQRRSFTVFSCFDCLFFVLSKTIKTCATRQNQTNENHQQNMQNNIFGAQL